MRRWWIRVVLGAGAVLVLVVGAAGVWQAGWLAALGWDTGKECSAEHTRTAGPGEPLLRMRTAGGVGGFGGPWMPADYTVYPDGRVLLGGQKSRLERGELLVREARLDDGLVRELRDAARKAGLGSGCTYESRERVTDTVASSVAFADGGRVHRTSVVRDWGRPYGDRARVLALVDELTGRFGGTDTGRPYRVERFDLRSETAGRADEAERWLPAWEGPDPERGCQEADAGQTRQLRDQTGSPSRGPGSFRWRGMAYELTAWPLLPGQRACAEPGG